MFSTPQQPYYKIYKQPNDAFRMICFENEAHMWYFKQDCAGDFLIEFLEMDLTEYTKALGQFGMGPAFHTQLMLEPGYRIAKEMLLDTAGLLSDNLHLHWILMGAMQQIFEDEVLQDEEKLEKAYLELLYIVQMFKQFSNALHFCLDADNYTEMGIAQKFAGFTQSSKWFHNYRFQTGYGIAPVEQRGDLSADTGVEGQHSATHGGKDDARLLPFTYLFSFEDLMFYDFFELVSQGLSVKRCKLCGKFFVQKSKHKAGECSAERTGAVSGKWRQWIDPVVDHNKNTRRRSAADMRGTPPSCAAEI